MESWDSLIWLPYSPGFPSRITWCRASCFQWGVKLRNYSVVGIRLETSRMGDRKVRNRKAMCREHRFRGQETQILAPRPAYCKMWAYYTPSPFAIQENLSTFSEPSEFWVYYLKSINGSSHCWFVWCHHCYPFLKNALVQMYYRMFRSFEQRAKGRVQFRNNLEIFVIYPNRNNKVKIKYTGKT